MTRTKKLVASVGTHRAAAWDAALSQHKNAHATYVEELVIRQQRLVALAAFGQVWGLDLKSATVAGRAMFEKQLGEMQPPAVENA